MTHPTPGPSSPPDLRPPQQVMRLDRMGSFHQSRLSFMRILLRRLRAERWQFTRPVFDIDENGVGRAVYTARGPDRAYSLVAFGHDLPDDQRSDRVIAEAWDATFALFDGEPTPEDIDRLAKNVPLQEAGRVSEKELSLSRANRSVRLFNYVVEALAAGRQPDAQKVQDVGYLMRTTAVYGSGKFGAADRETIAARPECAPPFQIEMLAVYLIRTFVLDLVEHMAALRAPDTAVGLDPALRRRFGIGNSTGLGMAPFLINHPVLLNNWIAARETALQRVRALPSAHPQEIATLRNRLGRARLNAETWHSDDPVQTARTETLRADLAQAIEKLDQIGPETPAPWDRLYRWAEETLSLEGQEQIVSLLFEPYGALIDDLAPCMSADEAAFARIDGTQSVGDLCALVEEHYDWALGIDWTTRDAHARAWYVSAEKLEPRLGERFEEPIEPYEQPLGIGRDAAALYAALQQADFTEPCAAFLMRQPEHRHMVRRVQIAERCPYAEIRDNTIDAKMRPIDMLRCKLSFFGAGHFDPRSDRWVRINMFQGAPFPHELFTGPADDWAYPPLATP